MNDILAGMCVRTFDCSCIDAFFFCLLNKKQPILRTPRLTNYKHSEYVA